ncbi:hypothetical protein [Mahella sp.]|uniref:DUF7305 domain-containing protein n=1 Tax=Mahella sp. TaxID=2798721 RepID=UPI0025C70E58|nr:hypothetical protein [Mahella sp.]MBZ4665931.1 hypothetical protein [Mahella sp.]
MRKKGSKGSALMLTVMISLTLLTLAAGMSFYAVAEVKQTALQQKKLDAYYVARSGAEAAVGWLTSLDSDQAADLSFPIQSNETPFGNGSFRIAVEDAGDTLLVTSTGRVKDTNGYIEDEMSVALDKVRSSHTADIEYAIFARSNITTSGGGNVSGDIAVASDASRAISISGNPSLQNCVIHIPEGANPNVVIDKPNWYDLPPVETDISEDGAYELPTSPSPIAFPVFPNDLPAKEGIELGKDQKERTIQGSALYNYIKIAYKGCMLTIDAQSDTVIRIKELNISSDGKIKITGGGRVTLYIDSYTGSGGFFIESQHPENVAIYWRNSFQPSGQSTIDGDVHVEGNVNISAGVTVKGDIYMSGSNVSISGGANIAGDIRSGNAVVNLSGGAKIGGDIYTSGSKVGLSGGISVGGSIYGGNTDIIFSGGATVEGNIVTAGDTVNMSGGTDIVNGVLYAPAATVNMSGGAAITGGLIADTVNMSGGPTITYNTDVISDNPVIIGGSAIKFEMRYWK